METVSNEHASEHQERDEFDVLGQAALTDYELTQQAGTEVRYQSPLTSNSHNLDSAKERSDLVCLSLQEQLCTLEGENKYLRTHNQKLELQLRDIEDSKLKYQVAFEQEALRHQESVKSDLAFKEKEIQDLKEKCCQLSERLKREQMSIETSTSSGLPVCSSGKHIPLTSENSFGHFQKRELIPNRTHLQPLNLSPSDPRPARKRPRKEENGNGELNTNEHELIGPFDWDGSSDKNREGIPGSLTFACHLTVALANEGETNLVKELIKRVLSKHPPCDCTYPNVSQAVVAEQSELMECSEFESTVRSHESSCESDLVSDTSHLSSESLSSLLSSLTPSVSPGDNQSLVESEESSSLTVCSDGSQVHVCSASDTNLSSFQAYLANSLDISSSSVSPSLYNANSCALYSCGLENPIYDASVLKHIEKIIRQYYATIRSELGPETSCVTLTLSQGDGDTCSGGMESESEAVTHNEASYSYTTDDDSPTLPARLPPLSPSSHCSTCSSQSTLCSCSSTTSQDLGPVVALQKRNVLHVFSVLRVLCKYNRQACRDIVFAKRSHELLHGFALFGHSYEFTDDSSMDSTGTCSMEEHSCFSTVGCAMHTVKYREKLKNGALSVLSPDLLSDRIQVEQQKMCTISSIFQSVKPVNAPCQSGYSGNLFDLLLHSVVTLTNLQLKKEADVLNIALEILISLTEDCTDKYLERYSLLIQKDQNCMESLLRREDPLITLNVLALLTEMARSASVVAMLCSSSKSCVLGNCYTLFCKPPSPVNSDVTVQIWMQLVRFICQVLCTEGGEAVLLESSCGCSLSLLRSLLTCLVDVVHAIDGNTDEEESSALKESWCLLQMMFTTVHSIMQHVRQCEELRQDVKSRYRYLYCINTCLNWSKVPEEEMLQDLYQFILPDDEDEDG